MTARKLNPTDHPSTFIPISDSRTAKVNTDATERSMPPEIMTMVRPRTMSPNSANCRPRSLNAVSEKKPGSNSPKTIAAMTRTRNGIALSIQRLVSNSPIR